MFSRISYRIYSAKSKAQKTERKGNHCPLIKKRNLKGKKLKKTNLCKETDFFSHCTSTKIKRETKESSNSYTKRQRLLNQQFFCASLFLFFRRRRNSGKCWPYRRSFQIRILIDQYKCFGYIRLSSYFLMSESKIKPL